MFNSSYEQRTTKNLNLEVLRLCTENLSENDYLNLLEMGFASDDIEALSRLNFNEIRQVAAELEKTIFELRVTDAQALSHSIKKVQQSKFRKETIYQLIKLGASAEMMRQVAGLNTKKYSLTKKYLCLPQDSGGRPKAITEEEARDVWLYFDKQGFTNPKLLSAEQWLEICKATNVNADIAYRALMTWFADSGDAL